MSKDQACFVIGVNHHTAATDVRSGLALNPDIRKKMYELASNIKDLTSLFIVNTCNRSEITGIGNVDKALELFQSVNPLVAKYRDALFIKNGQEAIDHIFDVATGMNSQILGDAEILGQFKRAVRESKSNDLLNGYLERLCNTCVQAAKEVKHLTEFSAGTTSLSYAVIKYLKTQPIAPDSNVLVVGSGKFGASTAKNLSIYLPEFKLYLTNRTGSKATTLANEIGAHSIPYANWQSTADDYQIIIGAVEATEGYQLTPTNLTSTKTQYLIDLSVPFSMDPSCGELAGKELVTIDLLSTIINDSITHREGEVDTVRKIVQRHIDQFSDWSNFYLRSAPIREWKASLQHKIESCPFMRQLPEKVTQKYLKDSVKGYATYVKQNNELPPAEEKERLLKQFLSIRNN